MRSNNELVVPLDIALARAVPAGYNRIADFNRILEKREEGMMEIASRIFGAIGAIVAVIGLGLFVYLVITIFFSACDDIEKIREILEKKPKRRKK